MSHPESFIVCIEAFPDAVTLQYADLVLAPSFWCERDGVYGCGERRYSLTEKAVDSPGQCRPTVNTLVEFAKRAGVDPKLVNFKNAEDVWNEWRMNLQEKLRVAHQLEVLGVDIMEAGFPASSPGDFESVQRIASQAGDIQVAGLARCVPNDIDRCWEAVKVAKNPRIHGERGHP